MAPRGEKSPVFSSDRLAALITERNRAYRRFLMLPMAPPTWRDRLRRSVQRVRAYVSTLWDALRGRDPYDDWS